MYSYPDDADLFGGNFENVDQIRQPDSRRNGLRISLRWLLSTWRRRRMNFILDSAPGHGHGLHHGDRHSLSVPLLTHAR